VDSADGRSRTVSTPDGERLRTEFDDHGRIIKAQIEDGPTVRQQWRDDGLIEAITTDYERILPEYTKDGTLKGLVLAPSANDGSSNADQRVGMTFDPSGNVTSLRDDSGGVLKLNYDRNGMPTRLASQLGSVDVVRDGKGQVKQIDTSWGYAEHYDHGETGDLNQITLRQRAPGAQDEAASIVLDVGRITGIHQPDGGETAFDYYPAGSREGLLKRVLTPNGVALDYEYDAIGRLDQISISGDTTDGYCVDYEYDSKDQLTGIFYMRKANLTCGNYP
jgi:YD repeat-containing protein